MSSAPTPVPTPMVMCARHPSVETALTCGRCGTPICPACMVHSAAGIRCPDCARAPRLPMYTLGVSHILRAVAAGVVLAVPLGVLGAVILPPTSRGSIFMLLFALLMGMGAGTVVAEALTRVSGGKRGPVMIGIAAATMLAAAGVRLAVAGAPWDFALRDLAGMAIIGFAVVAASGRLR